MINKISNANVYINGVNLLGKLEEINLPTIKQKMAEFKALGMYATVELPVGLEKMEAKLKWNSFYPEVLAGANLTTATNLVLRANVEKYNPGGQLTQEPLTCIINGVFKSIPLGTFKPGDKVSGIEHTMSVYYLKQAIGDLQIVEVDVWNSILAIGAIDQLFMFKVNQ
ncbi:MAG: phage major tail tube protein [Bacteroidales bacterium]|jgi:P2 family phage contractile tail tube protein|nr:phage major tail tube protein [Bacteroidales bacterium]